MDYVRYSPKISGSGLTGQLVDCYRDVFAGAPWNEWLRCPICQKSWGQKDEKEIIAWEFRHCGTNLIVYWSREQVMADIEHEITDEASCWLAVYQGQVIGFCWGYQILFEALQEKLRKRLPSQLENSRIAYQDELGVTITYRQKKIAKALVSRQLTDFLDKNIEFVVVRTRQYP